MLIEPPHALLLLAHQDDEFAAQKLIEDAVAKGVRVHCAFLTQSPDPSLNVQRNQESLHVLRRLGVDDADVSFAGMALNIMDGQLQENLDAVGIWLKGVLAQWAPQDIWIPAWEGGHPDHDALHAVAVEITRLEGLMTRVKQFPLYNGWRCKGVWFRVMHPLTENGPVNCTRFNWTQRYRYLRHCLMYPSQTKSWIGLFPFVLAHMVFKGVQFTQGVSRARIVQRPHDGPLYYEKRGFSTWEKTEEQLSKWLKSL